MKKLIIFDLDGTLLDTSKGIMYCYTTVGEKLGLTVHDVERREIVIGGPLSDGFSTLYEIASKSQLDEAIAAYRALYSQEGINRFEVYDGISIMLKALKEHGFKLAVATLKLEEYAVKMLQAAGISEYFDTIKGWDGTDKSTKASIIAQALSDLHIAADDAVLVGDSEYDEKGAGIAGVDFLGVSYGFGLKNTENQKFTIVESPQQISNFLIQK